MPVELYRYQKQGVRRIEAFGCRGIIADDMGLGKTVQALMIYHRNRLKPAVVVTFASLKYGWESQARTHIGVPAEVLEGTRPPRRRRMVAPPPLVIVNYDILQYWLKWLKALNPQLVIIDECQAIRNPKTIRSRAVKALCKDVPAVVALSGTPLVQRPRELWPTLNVTRPDLYPAFRPFAYSFCKPRWTPWGVNFDGASNLDELNEQLKAVMVRRRKADVLRDLPPKRRMLTPLPLSDPAQYEEAEQDFVNWLRKTCGDAKARKAARAQRMVQMGYLKRLAGNLKLPAVGEWLDLFLQQSRDEKMAVFAVHRSCIGWLHERYGRRSVVVDGSVTGRARQRAFDQFLRDRRTRFLFGNIQAAGAGWSAKGVGQIAFAELPWSPGELLQAEDRSHGLGRGIEGQSTEIHYLVAHGTIEERLLRILQDKQDVLSRTLDGRGRGDDLDVYDLLERELTRGKA